MSDRVSAEEIRSFFESLGLDDIDSVPPPVPAHVREIFRDADACASEVLRLLRSREAA